MRAVSIECKAKSPVNFATWYLEKDWYEKKDRYEVLARLAIIVAKEEFLRIVDKGQRSPIIGSNQPVAAYSFVSMFRNIIDMHPYFKKKSLYILRAIIDRTAEAYVKKDYNLLYIPEEVVSEWLKDFEIDPSKKDEYLGPLKEFKILDITNKPGYPYKVNDDFFSIFARAAQFLIIPMQTETGTFAGAMSNVNGLVSLYALAVAAENEQRGWGPKIPKFFKLATAYTIVGAYKEVVHASKYPSAYKIDEVLRVERINRVDNYFVMQRKEPKELWRSVRTEAFEFMVGNGIIEGSVLDDKGCGYKLNPYWVRIHEKAIENYLELSLRREHYRLVT